MRGDNFSDGPHAVLGDVTNRPAKRGFSLVFDDLGSKSRDRGGKSKVIGNVDSEFAKRVCSGVENFVREKCAPKHQEDDFKKDMLLFKENKFCSLSSKHDEVSGARENLVTNIDEDEELNSVLDSSPKVVVDETRAHVPEVGDASRDSSASVVSATCSQLSWKSSCDVGECQQDDARDANLNPIRENTTQSLTTHVCGNSDIGPSIGKLASGTSGSIEWSRLPNSQAPKNFLPGRRTALAENSCDNLGKGDDLLKSCSCSFCLKAAYIWSDLHYRDIQGRIAALNKSQKEACSWVQKSARVKDVGIHGPGSSDRSSKLETDLMSQWTSLFHYMEDALIRESSQLQTGCSALKDLRDKCKMDLEFTTKIVPKRQ